MFTFTFYGDGFGWDYIEEEDNSINFGYAIINGEWVYGVLVLDETGMYFQPEHTSCIEGIINNGEIVTVKEITYSPFFA